MKYYDIETLTVEDLIELLKNGNDEHNNQLRVTKEGKVYLSEDIVGNEATYELAFRYETFASGNGYVGQDVNDWFINDLYNSLKENWVHFKQGKWRTYIDSF